MSVVDMVIANEEFSEGYSSCRWWMFDEEGKIVDNHNGYVCMKYAKRRGIRKPPVHLWAVGCRTDQDNPISKALLYPFLDYILNDSIFAPVYASKDKSIIEDRGLMLMNTNFPNNMVGAAAQCLRYAIQYRSKVETWCEMVKHTEPDIALFLLHCLVWNHRSKTWWPSIDTTGEYQFLSIKQYRNRTLENFLNRKMPGKKRSNFSRITDFSGITKLFERPDYHGDRQWTIQEINPTNKVSFVRPKRGNDYIYKFLEDNELEGLIEWRK